MRGKPHRLLPWQLQAIADGYRAGEKIEALAAEFGVSHSYVSQLAKHRGIVLRRPGHKIFGISLSNSANSVSTRLSPVIG